MLDAFDIKLLRLVQRNNRLTAHELAEEVGLSPSACHRRLKRMRDDGVIAAEIAVLAPETVGRQLTMIVTVTLEREHSDVIAQFKKTMRDMPEVMQCYYVTGDVDFVVILTARDMKDYEAFVERFMIANRNVKRFETMVVMDRVKIGLDIPIELVPVDVGR